MTKPLLLCILDGWGIGPNSSNNVIYETAKHYNTLLKNYPFTMLDASEHYVGLPKGQMGNSEVGHMTIGLGRVILQDLLKIDDALDKRDIQDHPLVQKMIEDLKSQNGVCHIMGLLSPGGIHSHQDHIKRIVQFLCHEAKIPVCFHAFLDGRDTPPQSAIAYIEDFRDAFKDSPLFTFQSIMGRYYAMDRDARYDRIQKAYEAIVNGNAPTFKDPIEFLKEAYAHNCFDEFVMPGIHEDYRGLKENDALWMCNFRADRVRQILHSIILNDFDGFKRNEKPKFLHALGFYSYSPELINSQLLPLLKKDNNKNSLSEIISNQRLKQLHIAETEKYAHVTFFFNGGKEQPFEGENRILIPSPNVATYDLAPSMSALEILEHLKNAINSKEYAFIVVNFANADMVGHTGIKDAVIKAIETVDHCIHELSTLCLMNDVAMIITADHGNAEQLYNETTNQPHTAHTLNKVPFLLIDNDSHTLKENGTLADVAPTILSLMSIDIAHEMTGKSLKQ